MIITASFVKEVRSGELHLEVEIMEREAAGKCLVWEIVSAN